MFNEPRTLAVLIGAAASVSCLLLAGRIVTRIQRRRWLDRRLGLDDSPQDHPPDIWKW